MVRQAWRPFKLFGALFGGDDEQVAPVIHFRYGSADLDTTETRKLNAVQKGLGEPSSGGRRPYFSSASFRVSQNRPAVSR